MSAVNRVLLETQQQTQSPGLVSMEEEEAGGPQEEKTLAPAPGLQEAAAHMEESCPALTIPDVLSPADASLAKEEPAEVRGRSFSCFHCQAAQVLLQGEVLARS